MSDSLTRTHSEEILSFSTATEHNAASPPPYDTEEFKTQDAFTRNSSEHDKTGMFHSSIQKVWENRSSKKNKVIPFQKSQQQEGSDKGVVITRVFDRNRFSHSAKPLGNYVNIPLPPGFIPSEIMVPESEFNDYGVFGCERHINNENMRDGPKELWTKRCCKKELLTKLRVNVPGDQTNKLCYSFFRWLTVPGIADS